MDAVINQNPTNQARTAVRMLHRHINGEAIDTTTGRTPIEIFVREILP
jgi:ABC-type sugar transport system substrate-binding protein